jgi:hypothetical protein
MHGGYLRVLREVGGRGAPPDGPRLGRRSSHRMLAVGHAEGVLMSLHLLVVCEPGARERSEREYRSLLAETGFRDVEVIRLAAPRDLIVARKRLAFPLGASARP